MKARRISSAVPYAFHLKTTGIATKPCYIGAAAVDGFRRWRLPLIESQTCLMRGRHDARNTATQRYSEPATQRYRHRYSTRQEGQIK